MRKNKWEGKKNQICERGRKCVKGGREKYIGKNA
jgi:hypothetical protein